MKPLAVRELLLTNFKNYSETGFQFGPGFNLVCGLNGIGKTNLLDALYYLCIGKSYFTSSDQKVVRQQETFFRLDGHLTKGDESHHVVIKVKPGSLKEIVVDNILLPRISDHLGFAPLVISAPRDNDIVYGISQVRRRYFDHLICQVDHDYLKALSGYNHLIEMRNAALKQGFPELKTIIATYDEKLAPLATYIFEKRKYVLTSLIPHVQDIYAAFSEQKEAINLEYESDLHRYPYHVLVDMNWESDKLSGRSGSGIHKDDIKLTIKNMSARDHGSQGQIKSLIFALHLGKFNVLQRETLFKPLLILDDIFDKLDDRRLHRLIERLSTPDFGQIFISDTSVSRVKELVNDQDISIIAM